MLNDSFKPGDSFALSALFIWVWIVIGPWYVGLGIFLIGLGLNLWELNRRSE